MSFARACIRKTGDSTNAELIAAPAAGRSIVINDLTVTISAAGTIVISAGNDGADDDEAGLRIVDMYAPANGGIHKEGTKRYPITLPAATALKLTSTGGGNVKFTCEYEVQP